MGLWHEIKSPKQVLVEGRDAEEFFGPFLKHIQLAGVQIQNFGGISELRTFLRLIVKSPGFASLPVTSVGIVRDAEDDPDAAFQSVCSALQGAGLAVPRRPLTIEGSNPCVGVFLLPDGQYPGMIETLFCGR